MAQDYVDDAEVVFRRIPPGQPWFEAPDRMTTANFKTQAGETGLSVYRKKIVSADEVLAHSEAKPGSGLASARAGDIRQVQNAAGEALNLDVVADDANNPGHAEIRPSAGGKLTQSAAKSLRKLFEWVRLPIQP